MASSVGKKGINHFDLYGDSYSSLRASSRYYVYAPILRFILDGNTCFDSITIKSVLEVGCGGGVFLKELLKKIPKIYFLIGVDTSKVLLRELKCENQIEAILADACNLPLREDSFDLCLAVSLLHHIVDTTSKLSLKRVLIVFRELLRVTNSQGFVMINEEPMLMSRLISKTTFWLTRVYNIFSSNIPIVSFLIPSDIKNLIFDAEKSKKGYVIYSRTAKRKRIGRYFPESLYYHIINFTCEIFFVMRARARER